MRNKITLEMLICQVENGFSLDELVRKVADSYEKKAFADILKMNLQLTQEVLMYRIFNGKSNLQCCSDGHLTLNGSFERRIRTSLGEFKMDFWRVRCSKCGKTFAPLAKFIGLERYQTKSNELEKLVIEAVSGTNYRRAVNDLERDGKLPVSFHTAHGWVMRSDCDEIKISPQTVGSAPIQIMPDGTGFKGSGVNGQARKGDLKVVIGISQQGNIFPLASKAGATWKDITDELISPRASSMVERVMRALGRRLKKTAYGWSDKGATRIARIILKRFTSAKAWEDYWQNKMNCIGNVIVNIGNYKCFSQNLGQ